MAAPQVSIVVPVYNSSATLPELVAELDRATRPLFTAIELILVNDGSRDGSWAQIEAQAAKHPWVKGIDLSRNFGQHNAILCGVRAARYPVVVTMDDDLQHPPEEIARLVARLDAATDVVYGAPEAEQHGVWRDLASWATKRMLQAVMGVEAARSASAFRAFRTDLRTAFDGYQAPHVSLDVLLSWATTRFAVQTVRHAQRRHGTSNYTLRKLVNHAINMFTGYSILPLRIASISGFVFTLFGAAVLAYVLIRYMIEGSSVAGFPFLASVIAIFSGVQLFSLGVIGEYLGRMHMRTQGKPVYAIRRVTDRRVVTPAAEGGAI